MLDDPLAHHRGSPPLPAGPGGAPRTYREESLLLIALLRTLWRLSYQDMRDWLRDWPALALACGLPLGKDGRPRVPCASQQWKRGNRAGAPLPEALFVLTVLTALRRRLMSARDLIIDSVPILAWRRADPAAAFGHAPAQHPRPLLRGNRVHTLICRGSGLPLFFRLQRLPLAGWSTVTRQVALTYTATLIVGLAAQHAGTAISKKTYPTFSGIAIGNLHTITYTMTSS